MRSLLGIDTGAIVLVQLESAIAFSNGCGCDRTCSIGECDRFLSMDVGAIVLVQLASAIASFF